MFPVSPFKILPWYRFVADGTLAPLLVWESQIVKHTWEAIYVATASYLNKRNSDIIANHLRHYETKFQGHSFTNKTFSTDYNSEHHLGSSGRVEADGAEGCRWDMQSDLLHILPLHQEVLIGRVDRVVLTVIHNKLAAELERHLSNKEKPTFHNINAT